MAVDLGNAYIQVEPSFKGVGKKVGAQFQSLGAQAGGRFSAAMGVAVGAASAATQAAMSAIGSSIGSAVKRVDTLNNFPRVMQNLGYSASEASGSIDEMSRAIDGMPTSLDSLTSMVQQLAPITGSLGEATDIGIAFNDMLLSAGASTSDVSRAMQQYSQILAKGKPELEDWRTLQEVMPGQLSQMAKGLLGASASSNDLYQALKDGSVTMDEFNDAMVRLDKEGGEGFASFEEQARSSTAGIGTALENVGNRASKALSKVIDAIGAENISGAINAFSGSFSAVGDAAAGAVEAVKARIPEMKQAIGGFAKLWEMGETPAESFRLVAANAVNHVKATLSKLPGAVDQAASALSDRFPQASGAIEAVADAVKALPEALPYIAGFAGAFAAFGAVSRAVSPVVSALAGLGPAVAGLGQLAGVVKGVGAVQGPLAAVKAALSPLSGMLAALASPVGLVVTAVALLAAGFAYFYATSEPFRTAIGEIASQMMAALAPSIGLIAQTLMAFAASVMPAVMSTVQAVAPVLQQIILVVAQLLATVIPVVAAVVATVLPVVTTIVTAVANVVSVVASALMPIISNILSAVQAVLPVVGGIFTTVFSAVSGVVTTVMGVVGAIVTAVMQTINAVVSGDLGSIQGIWQGAWNTMQSLLSNVWNGIKNGVSGGIDAVMGFVSGLPGQIMGVFSGAASWLVDAGGQIISGLISGISGAVGGAISAVTDAVGSVIDGAKSALGIASPSKVFREIGVYTMAGLEVGVEDGERPVLASLRRTAERMAAWEPAAPAAYSPAPAPTRSGPSQAQAGSVVEWLEENLGSIIERHTPYTGERDLDRIIRKAVPNA